jgi:hypothetical protein
MTGWVFVFLVDETELKLSRENNAELERRNTNFAIQDMTLDLNMIASV